MAVDIKTISEDELRKDLRDSYKDISDCTRALSIGVFKCGSGSVQKRLDSNKGFVKVITAELERRENQ